MAAPLRGREPDAVNPSLADIGARLREAREARGLEHDELATLTRIHARHLKALEDAREDLLPEPFYVKSFVRKVGDAVGLDGAELARLYWEHRPSQVPTAPLEPPVPEVVMPWWVWPMMAAAVLGAVLGTMALTRPDATAVTEASSPAPFETAAAGLEASSSGRTTETVLLVAVPGEPGASATLEASGGGAPAPELASASPTPLVAKAIRLGVRTSASSWMRVMADGKIVQEGIVPGGMDREWGADGAISVRIGQPAAVEGRLNGKPLGRLGEPSASVYVATYRLTPRGVVRILPAPPAVAPVPQAVTPVASAAVRPAPSVRRVAPVSRPSTRSIVIVTESSPSGTSSPGAGDSPSSSSGSSASVEGESL
ncbi:MAG: RodZ domain-containing protein [Candidatus Sericytochromatia bacterium]|nr:RodZ domain-containing protein [Candidatus Sericytochromatia bacterium]